MASRTVRKRPRRFLASDLSSPTITGERPISLEQGAHAIRLSREAPDKALLYSIDEIAHTATQLLASCGADGDLNQPDTLAGFAWRIVTAAGDLRWRIMNASEDPPEALQLANDVMRLVTMYHAMSIEFLEGDGIERWRELVEARRHAALGQKERRQLQAQADHLRWQNDALEVWRRNPRHTKTAVAVSLAAQYRRTRGAAAPSANTIRQVIKKPDAEQCPPSAHGAT